jgi:phage shock protein PspC (stress-responsive transcriptional regulator)
MKARVAGKKLYRNPFDKMLAGVLSGFAAYTGTDAI